MIAGQIFVCYLMTHDTSNWKSKDICNLLWVLILQKWAHVSIIHTIDMIGTILDSLCAKNLQGNCSDLGLIVEFEGLFVILRECNRGACDYRKCRR